MHRHYEFSVARPETGITGYLITLWMYDEECRWLQVTTQYIVNESMTGWLCYFVEKYCHDAESIFIHVEG